MFRVGEKFLARMRVDQVWGAVIYTGNEVIEPGASLHDVSVPDPV